MKTRVTRGQSREPASPVSHLSASRPFPSTPASRESVQPEVPGLGNRPSASVSTSAPPPLEVSHGGDPSEREADQVAADVVERLRSGDGPDGDLSAPAAAGITSGPRLTATAPLPCGPCGPAARFCVHRATTEAAGGAGGLAAPGLAADLRNQRVAGLPLAPAIRRPLENAFGSDFRHVRIHQGGEADRLSQRLQAHAFTMGEEIFFRRGAFQPRQPRGQAILAHELTHVLQQRARQPAEKAAGNLVQRLAVREHPVNASQPPLSGIKELTGGHKGMVYLFSNATEKLVVKLQNEAPTEALIGTEIMKVAGARTPDLRVATPQDISELNDGLNQLESNRYGEAIASFRTRQSTFSHALIMDFAGGQTIMAKMRDAPTELIDALQDPAFQWSFGKMLAADAFSGNPDRAFAGQMGFGPGEIRGWYHEQNFLIEKSASGFHANAIDNAFQPELILQFMHAPPYGWYATGIQMGSVAAAHERHSRIEFEHIFDRMLREFRARMEANAEYSDDGRLLARVDALENERATFAANAARGAAAAMRVLLHREQSWEDTLRRLGANDRELENFRDRKRFLERLRSGDDPQAVKQEFLRQQQTAADAVRTESENDAEQELETADNGRLSTLSAGGGGGAAGFAPSSGGMDDAYEDFLRSGSSPGDWDADAGASGDALFDAFLNGDSEHDDRDADARESDDALFEAFVKLAKKTG